jgi:hypothetical protein
MKKKYCAEKIVLADGHENENPTHVGLIARDAGIRKQ